MSIRTTVFAFFLHTHWLHCRINPSITTLHKTQVRDHKISLDLHDAVVLEKRKKENISPPNDDQKRECCMHTRITLVILPKPNNSCSNASQNVVVPLSGACNLYLPSRDKTNSSGLLQLWGCAVSHMGLISRVCEVWGWQKSFSDCLQLHAADDCDW